MTIIMKHLIQEAWNMIFANVKANGHDYKSCNCQWCNWVRKAEKYVENK